jgi:hypothetical protein
VVAAATEYYDRRLNRETSNVTSTLPESAIVFCVKLCEQAAPHLYVLYLPSDIPGLGGFSLAICLWNFPAGVYTKVDIESAIDAVKVGLVLGEWKSWLVPGGSASFGGPQIGPLSPVVQEV